MRDPGAVHVAEYGTNAARVPPIFTLRASFMFTILASSLEPRATEPWRSLKKTVYHKLANFGVQLVNIGLRISSCSADIIAKSTRIFLIAARF